MVDDFNAFQHLNRRRAEPGKRRWYDTTFVKKIVESFETVPPYKRDTIANKIIECVDAVFRNEINRKVNTNKDMILGMYKEYEKRRWYDKNPTVLKSIKEVCSLVDQRRELQKVAISGIIDSLGEYYKRDEPKVEIRPPEMEPIPEPVVQEEPKVEEPAPPPPVVEEEPKKKAPDSKVMVSGEKLFIKRDKKPKPKI